MVYERFYVLQRLFVLVALVVAATAAIDATYQVSKASSSGFVHLRRDGEPQRKLSSLLAEGKRAAMYEIVP